VVATRRGSAPELITHGLTGFVCSDERALIDALGRVDRLDRTRCRKAAADRFSTTRMVADHLDLYRSYLANGRTARRRDLDTWSRHADDGAHRSSAFAHDP
jgi:glycosyltransferase involved in cell wall biosynthesis